jgi:hypothetical protein
LDRRHLSADSASLGTTVATGTLRGKATDRDVSLRFTSNLAGIRATMKIEPSNDQVKVLLNSTSRATHARGGKTDDRD